MQRVTKFSIRDTLSVSTLTPSKDEGRERLIVQEKVVEMLRKEAIVQAQNDLKQLSSIFIISKKSAGFRPVINLKKLNSCVE